MNYNFMAVLAALSSVFSFLIVLGKIKVVENTDPRLKMVKTAAFIGCISMLGLSIIWFLRN